MKKLLVIAGMFALLPGWYSCTRDRAPYVAGTICDSTQVSYSNTIARIMSTYCTQLGGCHNLATGLGSSAGVTANDLTTLFAVKNEDMDTTGSTSIVCWIKSNCGTNQMPKGLRPLNPVQAYVDTFLMWKANNYCQ
jgi:hypothetical protein